MQQQENTTGYGAWSSTFISDVFWFDSCTNDDWESSRI